MDFGGNSDSFEPVRLFRLREVPVCSQIQTGLDFPDRDHVSSLTIVSVVAMWGGLLFPVLFDSPDRPFVGVMNWFAFSLTGVEI